MSEEQAPVSSVPTKPDVVNLQAPQFQTNVQAGVFTRVGNWLDNGFSKAGTAGKGVFGSGLIKTVLIAVLAGWLGGMAATHPLGCNGWHWPIPTPGPGPTPPGPTPSPAPIPASGLRVLILYDNNAITSLSADQQAILYGEKFRSELKSKCVSGSGGDGHEYRIWPDGVDTTNEAKLWQDVTKRPHASLPWLVISNGTTGYEGPLPKTVDEAMTLLSKYEGK